MGFNTQYKGVTNVVPRGYIQVTKGFNTGYKVA